MTNRNREFHQNSAHMLIGALRQTYGPSFAAGCADNERLKGLDKLKQHSEADAVRGAPKMVDLSESARTILLHFKVRGMHEKDYETPAALGQLFNHPQECESAEAELVTAGLWTLPQGQVDRNGIGIGFGEQP
jgi:hypothetical protein